MGALAACGGGKPVASASRARSAVAIRSLDDDQGPSRPATARAHPIGSIDRRAIGPFGARSAAGGVVAWIVGSDHGPAQDLVVVPTSADGAPMAAGRVVATVPVEATSLVVRASGSPRGGWILAWTALLDRGEVLSVVGLAPDGAPRWPAIDVQRTSDHVQWADVVAGPHGATCVWAEEPPAGGASILAAALDADGRPSGMPAQVARGVHGWSVARDGDGVAMALVTRTSDDKASAGALSWIRLGADARLRGPAVPIGARPTVNGDVDLVPDARRVAPRLE